MTTTIEAASRWFDGWAEAGRGDSMAAGHWPMVSQIIPKMGLRPGLRCLDVGCGNGYATRALAGYVNGLGEDFPQVGETVLQDELVDLAGWALGIDVAPKMVEEARKHPENPANVRFEVASADRVPVASDSIDRLLSVETLYYFSDPLAALKEWNRALRSGGSVWIMVDYYRENPYSHTWPDLIDIPMRLYSEKEYRQLLEKAGFTAVVSERLHNGEPLSLDEQKRFQPGWGYRGVEDVLRFRNDIGSLLVCGKKSSLDIPE